jgi:hypothetical protein
MADEKFKLGDVVSLRSGGPRMTIATVDGQSSFLRALKSSRLEVIHLCPRPNVRYLALFGPRAMGTVTHRIYGPNPLLLIRRPSSTRTESEPMRLSEETEKCRRVTSAAAVGSVIGHKAPGGS